VYVSSLELSVSVQNLYEEQQAWNGIALSAAEFEIIPSVDRWLQPIAGIETEFLDMLFNYITPARMRLSVVHLEYVPSPRSVNELDLRDRTVIIIGGTAHNAGAKLYCDENSALMETDDSEKGVRIMQGRYTGRLLTPTNTRQNNGYPESEVARLEKIVDIERNAVAFIAEGVGTNGTLAAMHHLITHWEQLHAKYGDRSFAICLECPSREKSKTGYSTPSVLFEIPNGAQRPQR